MIGETRGAVHDTNHFDKYWFSEKCPDAETRRKIMDVCPSSAIVEDKKHPGEMHLHFEQCNQCGRCLQVAPPGSLKIDAVNFHAFQEACAISTAVTLSTFEPQKTTYISLATHMTPVCDCFGFTSMPILPDAGIFGSDDIVAIDQATLDMTMNSRLYEENIPTCLEVHTREGHPFAWLHGPLKDPYKVVEYGEKLGLGSRQYDLVDVFPVQKFDRAPIHYIFRQVKPRSQKKRPGILMPGLLPLMCHFFERQARGGQAYLFIEMTDTDTNKMFLVSIFGYYK